MGERYYAEIGDLYAHGVPRGSLVAPARLVSAVNVSSNRLELGGHGLKADTPILFSVDLGGTLPAPLAVQTVYYARLVELASGIYSESLFEVSLTEGGDAVDLTDEGEAPFRLFVPTPADALAECESVSRLYDDLAIGHVVPFTAPIPAVVRAAVAKRWALERKKTLGLIGADEYIALCDLWFKETSRTAKGAPLRDATATARTNLAMGASPTAAAGTDDWSVLP